MVINEIESEGYRIKAGRITPAESRSAKSVLLLSKGNYKYLSWSFDGKEFTIPMKIENDEFKKCISMGVH